MDSIDRIAHALTSSPAPARVSAMLGAGISVAAGVPDFRSPGGMYATLRPELLTATQAQRDLMRDDPTRVVSLELFEQNQLPHLEVRRNFILGVAERRWKPTLAHRFLQVLDERGTIHQSSDYIRCHCFL